MRKKRNKEILQDVPITGYAAEGRAIARLKKENEEAGKILFVSSVIPGDRADILVVKNKKDWAEGLDAETGFGNEVPWFACGGAAAQTSADFFVARHASLSGAAFWACLSDRDACV